MADHAGEADAPEGGGSPFAAAGAALGEVVGEAGAQVVEEQVGERGDHLVGQGLHVDHGRHVGLGAVAGGAADLDEPGGTGPDLGVVAVAQGGHGDGAGVEGGVVEEVVPEAFGGQVVVEVQVDVEGVSGRGEDRGVLGLPAEPACGGRPVVTGGFLQSAADAVSVGVVGVGHGPQVVDGDGLEQSAAEHRWGGAQRGRKVGDVGAVDGHHRASQRKGRPVGVGAWFLQPFDGQEAVGAHAAVLELLAELGAR